MDISNSPNTNSTPSNNPIKSHVDEAIEKIANNPARAQAELACLLFMLSNGITKIFTTLNEARGKCNLAAIEYGLNSAKGTALSGALTGIGGIALGGAGIAQGAAACSSATKLAQAQEIRGAKIAHINARITKEPDITIKVEAVNEPIAPTSSVPNELEEEIFYDAEETLSCKQTKPEEETENSQMAEGTNTQNKITKEHAAELIEAENKEYDIKQELIQEKGKKFAGFVQAGQGVQTAFQGGSTFEKSQADKDTLVQQTEQDNQNQLGNTVDGIKRTVEKLTEFDPFRQNSGSLKG